MADNFGVHLDGDSELTALVCLGLRRNPKRAHLLVSRVLGKHIPADPTVVYETGLRLGRRVGEVLGSAEPVVLGFAETATGLGHCVAEALEARYVHSTRRTVPGVVDYATFVEEHSHAIGHRLLPEDPMLLCAAGPLVLVDDELSTGRTALNTIAALHAMSPRTHYVLASLVDVRSAADRADVERRAAELGVHIDAVSLATGTISMPNDLVASAAGIADSEVTATMSVADVRRHTGDWPQGIRESGRHGFGSDDVGAAGKAAEAVAVTIRAALSDERVLVLGTEELMYAPLLIASALAETVPYVRVSSTTRSPVVVLDDDGYPIRNAVRFDSHDPAGDDPGPRFAYNVHDGYSDIVLVVDADADTADMRVGLVECLRPLCDRVHVVVLPTHRPDGVLPLPLRGPEFGSYAADEVAWLLTDLSHVALEAPAEEREEAIQSGGAHYAESLPIEYQPDAEYHALFDAALSESAQRIAHAVGVVTEIVLAERGPRPVLASLARAGTPVGVLMRRWARFAHGLDLPHYALSIVRGRGIDETALRYLAAHHDPADVVFVDGWTGKGAIAKELVLAVDQANAGFGTEFSSAIAVLADPGGCVETFGTREDFLVPSACLNSTVSGLVSRTVLNTKILGPGAFHGAKFYRELAECDVSARFVDAISARFADVVDVVARDWPRRQTADRTPTWAGWRDVVALSEQYGIGDVTLVKPGVGETTRVLLRRVPWVVLVRPGAESELRHIRLLARQRGVPLHEVPGLSYSCVGLIHPRHTRGATGSDGRSVRR